MLPFIASENMFKVISLKDSQNCGEKKKTPNYLLLCSQ